MWDSPKYSYHSFLSLPKLLPRTISGLCKFLIRHAAEVLEFLNIPPPCTHTPPRPHPHTHTHTVHTQYTHIHPPTPTSTHPHPPIHTHPTHIHLLWRGVIPWVEGWHQGAILIHRNKAKRWEGCKCFVVFGATKVGVFVNRFGQRHLDLSTI